MDLCIGYSRLLVRLLSTVSIKIGRYNPQYYEVIEGLEEGEKVITSNYDLFGDNEKIEFK